MKQIEIGDTVVRRVSERDSWWNNCCYKHNLPVDGCYVVVGFNSDGDGLKLQGFHSDYEFTATCFDLVEFTSEQEYKEAKKLIGKTVKFKGGSNKFRVEKVILRRDDDNYGISQVCQDYLKKHGYVVVVIGDSFLKPFPEIELVPDEITLKLNDSYDAVVTKRGITVGCQTFSHDILKELYKLSCEVSGK